MILHLTKVFLRFVLKSKRYSLINLFGLVTGITASMLIGLYVLHEKSYDSFHSGKDLIYRVRNDRFTNGELTRQWAAGPMSIGSDLKRDFPEVKQFVRLNSARKQNYILEHGDKSFKEENILYASEDFFKMFSFPLLKGEASTALVKPFAVVISESMAKRYFGDEDPLGKTLLCNKAQLFEVTGVVKDLPENTHFRFDALFSFESLLRILGPEETNSLMTNWGWIGTYTYIQLRSPEDVASFEEKIPAYVDMRMGKVLREWNEWMTFSLQPLTSIHLYSNEQDEIAPNGDGDAVQLLIWIAGFILAMAWINYVNLTTARSLERAREIGVRKVLGSNRAQLIRQFIFESLALNLIALVFATLLTILMLPVFSTLVSRTLSISQMFSMQSIAVITVAFLTGTIASGVYPALVLSGYKPLSVIKGFDRSVRGVLLRKGLVTIQFICSVILIAGTFIGYKQLHFMKARTVVSETDQVLVMHGPVVYRDSTYRHQFNTFRNAVKSFPEMLALTVSTDVPGHAIKNTNGNVRIVGQAEDKGNAYQAIMADEDFLETYGLELISGQNFSGNQADEWNSVIVNETAMRKLGFTNPEKLLGQKIYLWDSTPQVIGVIKDYHQESLKSSIPPMVVIFDKGITQYFSLRFNKLAVVSSVLGRVKAEYEKAFEGNPFVYFFMDDYFDRQYASDVQFATIFNLFTGLAVVIACLGLFGLSSYLVIRRKKEISIRKVMGASARQIVVLVSKEFFGIVILANVMACPLVYFSLRWWLSGFAYRTDIGYLIFIMTAAATMTIAALTVSVQSLAAASVNPARQLRAE